MDVRKVATLAHLEISDEEVALYTPQMAEIVKYVAQLHELDTADIEPMLGGLTDEGESTVTTREGYFTRDEIIDRYAAHSGRDLSGLRFYEVFALFKIAVVIQQIYYRFVKGQTDDQRFASFGARVEYLAQHAAKMAAT